MPSQVKVATEMVLGRAVADAVIDQSSIELGRAVSNILSLTN